MKRIFILFGQTFSCLPCSDYGFVCLSLLPMSVIIQFIRTVNESSIKCPEKLISFWMLRVRMFIVYVPSVRINLCHPSTLVVVAHSFYSNWLWWRWINIWVIVRLYNSDHLVVLCRRFYLIQRNESIHLFPLFAWKFD